MLIDFSKIEEQATPHFLGGEGTFYADRKSVV